MPIDLEDLLDAGGFEEGGGNALFDTENDTIACCDLREVSNQI
jgi:hypothetical protein